MTTNHENHECYYGKQFEFQNVDFAKFSQIILYTAGQISTRAIFLLSSNFIDQKRLCPLAIHPLCVFVLSTSTNVFVFVFVLMSGCIICTFIWNMTSNIGFTLKMGLRHTKVFTSLNACGLSVMTMAIRNGRVTTKGVHILI